MNPTESTLDVAAAWVRRGTSKCRIFAAETVDNAPLGLELLLENALGPGDRRQVDGVGGVVAEATVVRAGARAVQLHP